MAAKPPGKPPKPPGDKPKDTVKTTWDTGLQRQVANANTATVIRGIASGDLKTGSFYDVAEMVYQEADTDPKYRYLFSGSRFMLQPQISLFNALRDFMRTELKLEGGEKDLDLIDFNRWVEEFEDGYPAAANKPPSMSIAGQPWGLPDRENRPRILILPASKYVGVSTDRIAAFYPDRSRVDDVHFFAGSFKQIREQVQNTWAMIQRLKSQTIGAWVGYPLDQHLRQQPKSGLVLMLTLTPERGFPWDKIVSRFPNGKALTLYRSQVAIPYPKRSALDHGILREACGGATGLNWGHYIARAYVSPIPGETQTRGLSQLVARGSTDETAEANLLRFAALSDGFIVDKSVGVKKFTPPQLANPRTAATRNYDVYPGWALVENAGLVAASDTLPGGGGYSGHNEVRLYLNSPTKPAGWDDILQSLIRQDNN
jgi:hypothetical protein